MCFFFLPSNLHAHFHTLYQAEVLAKARKIFNKPGFNAENLFSQPCQLRFFREFLQAQLEDSNSSNLPKLHNDESGRMTYSRASHIVCNPTTPDCYLPYLKRNSQASQYKEVPMLAVDRKKLPPSYLY